MLDINLIRQNPEQVKKGISAKNVNPKLVDDFLALDEEWRKLTKKIDDSRAEQNKLSDERKIDPFDKLRVKPERVEWLEEAKKIKDKIRLSEKDLKNIEKNREKILWQLPNLPLDDVPLGKSEKDNVVICEVGKKPEFKFQPKDHLELGEALDIIDVKKAGQITGTRFNYLKGELALMEFALVQYVFSVLTNPEIIKKLAKKIASDFPVKIFIPVIPPIMIKPEVYVKMARLDPGQEEERFFIPKDNLYLVGSAEHTLGPLHMDEIIDEKDLPLRYVGFSTCFRREAGSYGKDTRGILRVHQFDKVEMESFTLPELSIKEQEFFVAIQEYIMQELKIPYQVVEICTGDMGGPNARQIDIEAWMPGQGKYRETHTADLMTDYQSRRLNTKVKRKDGGLNLVHMNDATAFAIGRTLIAILENYQQKDGTILVPKVLQKYLGFSAIG